MKPLFFVAALASLAGCATTGSAASASAPEVAAAPPELQKVEVVAPQAPTRREQVRKILPTSVKLAIVEGETVKRSASGVVIANEATSRGTNTYIVTNAHAVDARGLKDAVITIETERAGHEMSYVAELVAVGRVPDMDLALVKIRGVMLPAAELASEAEIELGDDVIVAASPYGNALSISGGMVSHVARDPNNRRPVMLKTDAPIGYGASGGGVYSLHSGKLLAIVEGYRTAKVGFEVQDERFSFDVPMPGETFAAPAPKVRFFLEQTGFGRLVSKSDPATAASR